MTAYRDLVLDTVYTVVVEITDVSRRGRSSTSQEGQQLINHYYLMGMGDNKMAGDQQRAQQLNKIREVGEEDPPYLFGKLKKSAFLPLLHCSISSPSLFSLSLLPRICTVVRLSWRLMIPVRVPLCPLRQGHMPLPLAVCSLSHGLTVSPRLSSIDRTSANVCFYSLFSSPYNLITISLGPGPFPFLDDTGVDDSC